MAQLFESPFFGIALSVIAFWAGIRIQKKTGLVACNPLIIAIVLIVGVLLVFRIPYEAYNQGVAPQPLFGAGHGLSGGLHLYQGGAAETELASHPGGMRGGISDLHGERVCPVPPLPAGRKVLRRRR